MPCFPGCSTDTGSTWGAGPVPQMANVRPPRTLHRAETPQTPGGKTISLWCEWSRICLVTQKSSRQCISTVPQAGQDRFIGSSHLKQRLGSSFRETNLTGDTGGEGSFDMLIDDRGDTYQVRGSRLPRMVIVSMLRLARGPAWRGGRQYWQTTRSATAERDRL